MTQQESWASSLHERLEISFVLVELSLTQKILYHMWKCYILLQDFFSELGIIYTFLEADLHYFRWHFFSHQNLYYLITNAVLLKSWGWDHLALNYHFSPMYFFSNRATQCSILSILPSLANFLLEQEGAPQLLAVSIFFIQKAKK